MLQCSKATCEAAPTPPPLPIPPPPFPRLQPVQISRRLAPQQTTKMELNRRAAAEALGAGEGSPSGEGRRGGRPVPPLRRRLPRTKEPARLSPAPVPPRRREPPRTQHVFTYCRASGTSCRCPARTIRKKLRSVLVDKLLDPLPLVYNIGHSCNRGQKRSPEEIRSPFLRTDGRTDGRRGQLRRAAAAAGGGTLRGAGLRSASSQVSAPPRRTKPGHPGPPHNLCGGAGAHWLRRHAGSASPSVASH